MKKILFILFLFLSIAPAAIFSQNRPDSVDNSTWFPPVEEQWHSNCSHFSLVYYLKSYLWNKHFQRDPNLPENKFSADFVWNQQVDPKGHFSDRRSAVDLLIRYGCATTINFPLQTIDRENIPGVAAREEGLNFRSIKYSNLYLNSYDSSSVSTWLNAIKDSLNLGVCFNFVIPVFGEMSAVTKEDPFYRWNSGMSYSTIEFLHAVTVVGYNDNKQAFKIINSWGKQFADSGYFYMGYDWFYNVNWWAWETYFLEEDFGSSPEITLNLNIQEMVSGTDIIDALNIFVDTVYLDPWLNRFDYQYDKYINFDHLVTIKKINNQIVPSNEIGDTINHTNNIIFLPLHNHDGNRQILEDLSKYVQADDFESLELLMVDPISATYIGETNNLVYSYAREAKAEVNEAYIKFLGTSKRIIGQVIDLPDTTIITTNFNSYPATYHLTPPSGQGLLPIKQCTSILKRKKITFSIEDTITYNAAPYFTSVPLDTLKGKTSEVISFQFMALDPEGDSLKYFLDSPRANVQLDSLTGLFQYQSDEPITEQFEVIVSDGKNNVSYIFIVKVSYPVGINDLSSSPIATLNQNYPNPFFSQATISFSLLEGGYTSLKVYNLLGKEITTLLSKEMSPGTYNVIFNAGDLPTGVYTYRLKVDGYSVAKKMVFAK